MTLWAIATFSTFWKTSRETKLSSPTQNFSLEISKCGDFLIMPFCGLTALRKLFFFLSVMRLPLPKGCGLPVAETGEIHESEWLPRDNSESREVPQNTAALRLFIWWKETGEKRKTISAKVLAWVLSIEMVWEWVLTAPSAWPGGWKELINRPKSKCHAPPVVRVGRGRSQRAPWSLWAE